MYCSYNVSIEAQVRLTEDSRQAWGLALLSRPPEGRWHFWLLKGLQELERRSKAVCEFYINRKQLPFLALKTSMMSLGCAFPTSYLLSTWCHGWQELSELTQRVSRVLGDRILLQAGAKGDSYDKE